MVCPASQAQQGGIPFEVPEFFMDKSAVSNMPCSVKCRARELGMLNIGVI